MSGMFNLVSATEGMQSYRTLYQGHRIRDGISQEHSLGPHACARVIEIVTLQTHTVCQIKMTFSKVHILAANYFIKKSKWSAYFSDKSTLNPLVPIYWI